MKKYNILVTGIGAIIGYGIVRSLRQCRYDVNIVGMDVYPDAVGQRWCDTFVQAVWASEPGYCDFVSHVIDQYGIDLVFPGLEPEILKLCAGREHFRGDFSKIILNNRELIEISSDKWLLHEYLHRHSVRAIRSFVTGDYDFIARELKLPFLLKPRRSSASKGIMTIESQEDFDYWKNKLGDNFMVQEIVGDDEHEYTVGVFGLADGTYSQSIAFSRKLSREGSTAKAKTVRIEALDEEVRQLTALFKPVGPTNFQFRRHGQDYLLLEVNPRFSSSLSLRTAFGFNEPEMCIDYFGEKVVPRQAVITEGTAVRYIEDVVNRP